MTFPYDYTLVNVITFGIGLAFLGNSYRLVRHGREDLSIFLLSSTLGLGLVTVAAVPNVFQLLATFLGLELKARAILVVSNLTLFVVCFYLFNRLVALKSDVSRLNEELSLQRRRFEDDE